MIAIPSTTGSRRLTRLTARLSLAATLGAAVLLVVLHGLKPELAPSWRFLSEYANGPWGWVMVTAFQLWAASAFLLAMAMCSEVASPAGRWGRILLLVVAASLIMAGVFPQDPVTTGPDDVTLAGQLHALAAMIGVPGTAVAALLIGRSLVLHNLNWAPYRASVMAATHLTWISLVAMFAYLAWAVPQAGGFTPEVWGGWMNRLVVTTYLLWQGVVAWRAQALQSG